MWLVAVIALRPDPLRAILFIPISFAVAALGFRFWIKRKVKKRLKQFGRTARARAAPDL